ncbi:MAG: magnesium/cobalt transporter CorA [Clostridia bacterium]|nr:magnesium/cobalt transporter CorA [Clostridia bacterium]
MQKSGNKRSSKAGLPPGSLVHIGRVYREHIHVSVFNYNEEVYKERIAHTPEECVSFRQPHTVTWINVDGINDVKFLGELGDRFDLHPLVLEDIVNTNQRPKVEDYGDYLYVVLRMLYYAKDEKDTLVSEQVGLIVGKDYVLSIQEGDEKRADVFESIRERIRSSVGKIRRLGPDFLMYSLIDAIVDNYFVVLERLDDKIEEAEDILASGAKEGTLNLIQDLKREALFLHKAIWPLREVASVLQREEGAHILPATRIFLRDVYDHIVQLMDTTETIRDILSGMLDIYLSTMSNRLNEVMKVLTIISTVFIPLTFIAGVYGMNFKFMPELEQPWAYPAVWIVMLVVAFTMLRYFKKKKWL